MGSDTFLVSCDCAERAFKRKTAALSPVPAMELSAEIDARLAMASGCFL